MALVFPVALPAVKLYCSAFDKQTMGESSVTQGGMPLILETGPALFKASYVTAELQGADFRTMQAWLDSIESPPQPFWGWDVRARFPRAYQGTGFTGLTVPGGGAWSGEGALASVADDCVTVGLNGLPAAFALGPGDPIAFDYGTASRAYHRIVSAPAVADDTGAISVEVRPIVRGGWVAAAAVYLDSPAAKFNLVPNSAKRPRSNLGRGTFTFDALQTLA